MKLTQDQIQQIETYLNFKKLTHLDIRNEVLDHIATAIEKSMQKEGLCFDNAFNHEIKKWHPELNKSFSYLIGWAWTGPKIMIDKGIKKTKQIYLRTFLITLIAALAIHLVNKTLIDKDSLEVLNTIVGSSYIFILSLIVFLFWRIKTAYFQTTFSFLFKINAIGFAFMYLTFNPLLLDSAMILGREEAYFLSLCFHSFLLSLTYSFWDLYKLHFASKKVFIS